jgi:hypothetical protein
LTAVHVANALLQQRGKPETAAHPQIDSHYLDELGLSDRLKVWRTCLPEPKLQETAA